MHARVAVFAVIFPGNLPFFAAFLQSLQRQTFRNFDLILAVDQVPDVDKYFSEVAWSGKVVLLDVTGSIASVRMQGIERLRREGYEYVIFCDTDDVMGPGRINTVVRALKQSPLVATDFSLINQTGEVTKEHYWATRLPDQHTFSRRELMHYNFAGLGNTACRGDVLKVVELPDELIAVDWFLFYQLLEDQNGLFIHGAEYFYRQHQANTAGVDMLSVERLKKIAMVKQVHYQHAVKWSPELAPLLERASETDRRLKDDDFAKHVVSRLNARPRHYFWWEETEYLYE